MVLQIFAALVIAGFVQVFLMGSGFVSPHNGVPGILTFIVKLTRFGGRLILTEEGVLTSPPFPVSSELETGGFSAVGLTFFGRTRSGSGDRAIHAAVQCCSRPSTPSVSHGRLAS